MDLTHNKIEYVICCVGAFAKRFMLTNIDCYAAEHTLSIDDAVDDIMHICKKMEDAYHDGIVSWNNSFWGRNVLLNV